MVARLQIPYSNILLTAQNALWLPGHEFPTLAFVEQPKMSYGRLLKVPLLRHSSDSPEYPMVDSSRFPYSNIRLTARNVL